MKNVLLLSAMIAMVAASCTPGQYATSGLYENDEVYFRKGDTYISDYSAPSTADASSTPAESSTS